MKSRLEPERKTMEAMIALYCHDQHGSRNDLCPDCVALYAYARQRLEKCPFGEAKPTCAKCTVHCYKPERREQIKVVMRYAGPRMLFQRPVLAIRHMLRERKAAPALPQRRKKQAADAG